MSWCNRGFTFQHTVVTLTFKIFSGLYLMNHKVYEVDTWYGHWLGGVGLQDHDVILI